MYKITILQMDNPPYEILITQAIAFNAHQHFNQRKSLKKELRELEQLPMKPP